jgi:hypothetical protein
MDAKATKVRDQAKELRRAADRLSDLRTRDEGATLTEEDALMLLTQMRMGADALYAAATKLEYVAGAALHALGEAMG